MDVEAAARAGADGAAKVTNPAASVAPAENEGLVSPVPPAAGASGQGPEGRLPGGGMFDRPHHRAVLCLGESLPTQEDDEAGERVWRSGGKKRVFVEFAGCGSMFIMDGGAPDAHTPVAVADTGCVADDAMKKLYPLTARWCEKRVESIAFDINCSQESSTPHGAA